MAATVKEEIDADEDLVGWLVGVKVADDGAAEDVHWVEVYEERVIVDERGARGCDTCHAVASGGFVLTPWPLD